MTDRREPYYRADLALVHHLGYAFHADKCAPGILELQGPVRERDGLVVELGCGSGLLTRHLVAVRAPGHRRQHRPRGSLPAGAALNVDAQQMETR